MEFFYTIIMVDKNQKKEGTVMEKKNVVIYVAGQRFSISTADTPEYVIGIGEKIDVMIKGLQKDNPKLNRDACAILTALNICDDETKLRQMMEILRGQVKDYLDANEKLRAENDALKEELKALREFAPTAHPVEPEAAEERNEETEEETSATPISVPLKSEETLASAIQRQTAFTGKNFSSDRHKNKKNKHKNHKQNQGFAPIAPPAPAATVTATDEADEAQAEIESPYHQFSIFDDLI